MKTKTIYKNRIPIEVNEKVAAKMLKSKKRNGKCPYLSETDYGKLLEKENPIQEEEATEETEE